MDNVEYFNYLGSMISNDARCTYEIKSRIVMAKAGFTRKKTLFHQKTGPKFKEETAEVLHFEYSSLWCGNLNTSEIRSQIPAKFEICVGERWRRSVGPTV
jgi:hypothetical protein